MQTSSKVNLWRHPREGGDPRKHDRGIPAGQKRLTWMPACAGMTLAFLFAGSAPVLAHTGAEHAVSFASGFAHPWSGLDHMLAMLAVGLWAGANGGRALWAWPAAFVGVMLIGAALGIAGVSLPMIEPGILASVILLGLLVLAAIRLPVIAGAALVALFALLHGHAHGAELPVEAAAASYVTGFAMATALLHGIGLGVAHLTTGARGTLALRGAGALVAAAGVALVLT